MALHDQRTPGAHQTRRTITRVAFHSHLWLGVLFTVVLAVIAVTGILLNHKRALGLMPDVAHTPTGAFDASIPLARMAAIAIDTARAAGVVLPSDDPLRAIDRMDARPRNGFVKVRLRDAASTEVTVDLADGRVLDVGARGDAFLEKLHSGELFGDDWILLSDAGAVALLVTLVSGYWLWIAPRLSAGTAGRVRRRDEAEPNREAQ